MLQARHIAWIGCLVVAAMPWTSAVHAQGNDDASIEARLRRFAVESANADVAPRDAPAIAPTDVTAHSPVGSANDDAGASSDEAAQSRRAPFVGPHADFENRTLGGGRATGLADSDGDAPAVIASPTGGYGWVMQTITALGVVIALIFMLRAVANRVRQPVMGTANNAVVEVLSRVAVGQRHHVLLMRLGQRVLVVGETAGGMQTLATIDDPQEIAELLQAIEASKPQSLTRNFSDMLHTMHGDYRDEPGDTAEMRGDSAREQVSRVLGRIRALGGRGGRP